MAVDDDGDHGDSHDLAAIQREKTVGRVNAPEAVTSNLYMSHLPQTANSGMNRQGARGRYLQVPVLQFQVSSGPKSGRRPATQYARVGSEVHPSDSHGDLTILS